MCLLIAVCPLLPDIVYLKTSKEELWKRWNFVEGEQAQARLSFLAWFPLSQASEKRRKKESLLIFTASHAIIYLRIPKNFKRRIVEALAFCGR